MANKHTLIVDRVLTRLKLKQLRLLVAVGKHKSILHAAKELNISQPAATKMIKDLELDFEVLLFERSNRGVIPTIFGETLIRHGKLIFAQISNAAQELDDLSEGTSGRIVVGTLLAASTRLLPLAIQKTLIERPKVTIKLVEGTNEILMPALRSGELDMVVGRLSTHRHRSELEQIALFDERIALVTGPNHPLAQNKDLSFADLQSFGWLLPPTETTLRRQIDQYFISQNHYIPPQIVESVSYLSNRTLLQATNLIGVMPAHVPAFDITNGTLNELSFTMPVGTGPVGVSFRQGNNISPAASAFISTLQDVARAFKTEDKSEIL